MQTPKRVLLIFKYARAIYVNVEVYIILTYTSVICYKYSDVECTLTFITFFAFCLLCWMAVAIRLTSTSLKSVRVQQHNASVGLLLQMFLLLAVHCGIYLLLLLQTLQFLLPFFCSEWIKLTSYLSSLHINSLSGNMTKHVVQHKSLAE